MVAALVFRQHLHLPIAAAVFALAAGVAGCYAPSIEEGTLACASGNRCPRGFVCRDQGNLKLCYRTPADAAVTDANAGGDVATDGAHTDTRDAAADIAPEVATTNDGATSDIAADTATDIVTAGDGGSDSTGGDRGLGSSCNAGGQCASGVCADGVCCRGACSGRCEACNLQDNVGTCTAVAAGVSSPNGHPACPTDPVESCDRDGTCDGNRGCQLRRAGTSCGSSSCNAGMATPAPTCDGLGQCLSSSLRPCAPYACNGSAACFDSCTTSSQCQPPNSCVAGSCGPKGNGSSCGQASECASQHCVDGVCCNEACTEKCKACDVGTPGVCTQVPSGQPHGTRGSCAGSGTCAGRCSAASATACTYPGDETICRSASCSGTMATARAGCNGAGSCPGAVTTSCGQFVCDAAGTACLSACASDNHCATAARPYCDGGVCVSGRSNGARCQTAQECANQRCVDGVCCNDACQLPCQACDVAGHGGTCWPVPGGTPYGGRPPCGGTGTCAGYCNNLPSGQCFFPGSDKNCVCPSGLGSGTCNAMGDCRIVGGLCL